MGAFRKLCGALGIIAIGVGMATGQRYTSPPASTSVKIAGKEIRVDYYAPSMHGRAIFGKLIPYGRVWCPGANVATGLTTDADLQLGTLKIPRGSVSLWILPRVNDWTLIVNKQSGQHHLDYEPDQDVGRTRLTLRTLNAPVETLKIELRPEREKQGELVFLWENTEASVTFSLSH